MEICTKELLQKCEALILPEKAILLFESVQLEGYKYSIIHVIASQLD